MSTTYHARYTAFQDGQTWYVYIADKALRIGSVYSEYDGDALTGSKLAPVTLHAAREGKSTMESERTFDKRPDYRMEAIRAWATVVQQSLMMQGPDFAGEVGYLSRIIELAKEADE